MDSPQQVLEEAREQESLQAVPVAVSNQEAEEAEGGGEEEGR